MKRVWLFVFCLLLLSIVAFAHGGSTDENGGHTDNSTGDYHYHHGYPAHDHEDLDDDGDVDCPYDFDDKTDHGDNKQNSYEAPSHKVEEEKTKGDSVSEKWASAKRVVQNIFKGILIAAGAVTMLWMAYFFVFILIEAIQEWFKKK